MSTAIAVSDDEVDDDDLLSLVAAAEASAIASKRRKVSPSTTPAAAASAGGGATAVEEGSYMAALRGSRSALWQQQRGKRDGSKPVGSGRWAAPTVERDGYDAGVETPGAGASGAGSCFKCGQTGHWARDCGGVSGGGIHSVSGQGSEVDPPRKACRCGAGDCLVLTSNTPRNPGRKFYRCPVKEENGGCNFFEWCDNPTSEIPASRSFSNHSSSVPELSCPCGAGRCLVLIAKTGKNIGQPFYRCPLDQGEGSCGFFKWCNQYNSSADPPTTKSQFNTPQSTNYQSAGGKNISNCFKCGLAGHWARDCPKNESDSHSVIGGNSSASSGSCFKCGKLGHWARDCPAQDATFSAGRRKVSDTSCGSYSCKSK